MTQPTPAPTKKSNRKWIVLAVLAGAAIIGAVTSTDTDMRPTVQLAPGMTGGTFTMPPPAPQPTPEPTVDPETVYIVTLEIAGLGIENTYTDPADAINLGHQVCIYLESGTGDTMGAAMVLVDNGFTPEQAGYTVGAAVAAFCPAQG